MKLLLAPFTRGEELEDATLRVAGIASTESVDAAGEIVKADAMRAAIPAFKRFPTLRVMHTANAVGTVTNINVEKGVTYLEGLILDKETIRRVRAGVYRAFSIGGKVIERDSRNPSIITKLDLHEVSIVDSPANKDSILEIRKFVKPEGSASRQNPTRDQVNQAMARMTPEERLEVLLKAVEKFGRPVTTRNWSSTPGVR